MLNLNTSPKVTIVKQVMRVRCDEVIGLRNDCEEVAVMFFREPRHHAEVGFSH